MRKRPELNFSGLDNPTKVVTEGKDESENAQAKPITKVCKMILL